jgi:hypothetical protein
MHVTGKALGHAQTKKGTILICNWDKPKIVKFPSPEMFVSHHACVTQFLGHTINGIFRAKNWSKTHCSNGCVQHGIVRHTWAYMPLSHLRTPEADCQHAGRSLAGSVCRCMCERGGGGWLHTRFTFQFPLGYTGQEMQSMTLGSFLWLR